MSAPDDAIAEDRVMRKLVHLEDQLREAEQSHAEETDPFRKGQLRDLVAKLRKDIAVLTGEVPA
jgi:hypothetical protein